MISRLSILSILLYTTVVAISYAIVQYSIKGDLVKKAENKFVFNKKLPDKAFALICALFVLYNIYITSTASVVGGDRINYSEEFLDIKKTSSVGLQLIFNGVRLISGNINIVFYITTLICILLVLLAYRISEDASPMSLLLLFFSEFIFSTFVNLKQSYVNALAALFFILTIQANWNRKSYYTLLLVAIAFLFHPTGLILLPMYFIITYSHIRTVRYSVYSVLIILFLFFNQIMSALGYIMKPVLPVLAEKLFKYFADNSSSSFVLGDVSPYAFIKGLPYYYIAFLGLLQRNRHVHEILHYDRYMIISVISASTYLFSIHEYWLNRLIFIFLFPVFVFFTMIVSRTENRRIKYLHWCVVAGSIIVLTYRYLFLVYKNFGGF